MRLGPVSGNTNELSLSQVKLPACLYEMSWCLSASDSLEAMAAEVAAIKGFFSKRKKSETLVEVFKDKGNCK